MRRFYAPPENFNNQTVTLGFEESKHLRDVLRLRAGTRVSVFDGVGNEFQCEIESPGKRETVLKIIEQVSPKSPESKLNLTLAIGLLKGEKFDLVAQKCCELGVSSIVPLQTKRADVRIKDAREAEKKLERWRKIALEAAKQSGRARLMQLAAPLSFAKFIDGARGTRVLFAERGGESFANSIEENASEITAIVGSEGGWEESEIESARAEGFRIITLGGRILRAETAAITVSALLQNHFGDLS
jgi:16S rRNA (uracil1498-N3)-methyltransferase